MKMCLMLSLIHIFPDYLPRGDEMPKTAAACDRFQLYVFILLRRSANAVHRASTCLASQAQTSVFRFRPQRGQSPLQSCCCLLYTSRCV